MVFDIEKSLQRLELDGTVDWIGLREVQQNSQLVGLRDGKTDANALAFDHGLMVEVLVDGHHGYAATNQLNDQGVLQAFETASRQASASTKWACYRFDESVRPKVVGEYTSTCKTPVDLLSLADQIDLLVEASAALKVSDRIVQTRAQLQSIDSKQNFVSSNGSRVHQHTLILNTDFRATAREGSLTQTRSDNGYYARSYQDGKELADHDALMRRLRRIGMQADELLDAEDCPEQNTTLVLAPDQMMLQIHESIGHPLEIDRILGDERNYAGSSFVKLHDFGQLQYGSPLMNVTFDPTVDGEIASYAFDDTGNPASRQYLIKNGQLQRGLGSLESEARSGVAGVANARACSWNRPPIDRMANLNLEPGNSSFDDIIGSIESGVYMQSNRSWSIDDYRNKFQFGCEYGQKIEQGKLTGTVRNPNYRGITDKFWNNLSMVGNEDSYAIFGTPYCGKGEPNQVIRVGHASPVCAFDNVEVFGAGDDS